VVVLFSKVILITYFHSYEGFAAYAKVNAFAAAAAMGPPAIFRASPKSPKPNPFSSPSPTPNPFMSYASKANNYWNKMATNTGGASKSESGFAALAASSATFTTTPKPSFAGAFGSTGSKGDGPSSESGGADNRQLFVSSSVSSSGSSSFSSSPSKATQQEKGQKEGKSRGSGNNSDSEDNEEEVDGDEDDQSPPVSAPNSPSSSPTGGPGAGGFSAGGNTDNGEQGEQCLLQCRAKLFRLARRSVEDGTTCSSFSVAAREGDSEKRAVLEWIEIGTGPVRVLSPAASAGGLGGEGTVDVEGEEDVEGAARPCRVVMRRESQAGGVGECCDAMHLR
jgi:hypothetical protein